MNRSEPLRTDMHRNLKTSGGAGGQAGAQVQAPEGRADGAGGRATEREQVQKVRQKVRQRFHRFKRCKGSTGSHRTGHRFAPNRPEALPVHRVPAGSVSVQVQLSVRSAMTYSTDCLKRPWMRRRPSSSKDGCRTVQRTQQGRGEQIGSLRMWQGELSHLT